jgi:hypothetical protein
MPLRRTPLIVRYRRNVNDERQGTMQQRPEHEGTGRAPFSAAWLGVGIGIGIGVGAAIGAAVGDVATWAGAGTGFGVAIGVALGYLNRGRRQA